MMNELAKPFSSTVKARFGVDKDFRSTLAAEVITMFTKGDISGARALAKEVSGDLPTLLAVLEQLKLANDALEKMEVTITVEAPNNGN